MKYLFAMMDDQTRYLIAQEVADTKYMHDARDFVPQEQRGCWQKTINVDY